MMLNFSFSFYEYLLSHFSLYVFGYPDLGYESLNCLFVCVCAEERRGQGSLLL